MNIDRMKKCLFFLGAVLLCYCVEWSASYFTRASVGGWYMTLVKPAWNPPNIAFPIVWSLLYTMIGFSFGWILCIKAARTLVVFASFFIQLAANFLWSFSFFYLQSPLLGLINILFLLGAIVWNIQAFYRHSKGAAFLLVPYLIWVAYAATLNGAIWWMN